MQSPKIELQDQTAEAVRALIVAMHGQAPQKLPLTICVQEGRMYLARSSDDRSYHVVTAAACSCHDAQSGNRCQHLRMLFATEAERATEAARRRGKMSDLASAQREIVLGRLAEMAREKGAV